MGTNTLTQIGTVSPTLATGDLVDQYLTAISVDMVPRNNSGVPTDQAGGLGTASFRWAEARIDNLLLNNGTVSTISGDLTLSATSKLVATTGIVHNGALINFGDGSESDFTSTGNFTLGGDHHYDNFTLATGHTLSVGVEGFLVLRVKDTFTWVGDFAGDGNGAAGGQRVESTVGVGTDWFNGIAGDPGTLGGGSGGGGGGSNVDNDAGGDGGRGGAVIGIVGSMAGGDGGNENDYSGLGQPGQNSTSGQQTWCKAYGFAGCGSGGGSGAVTNNTSGKGGNGGAGITIIADTIVVTGTPTISANGAAGSNALSPGDAGAGGGGGGGAVLVIYRTLSSGSIPTATVAGGSGATFGADAGDGGNGFFASLQI